MMIETTNHDWIRILILDVMSNLIDKVENENSNYKIFGIVFATPRLTQTWKFPSIFVDTEPRTDWMANNELLLKPWYHIML